MGLCAYCAIVKYGVWNMPFLEGPANRCAVSNRHKGIVYVFFRILLHDELIDV